MAGFRLGIVKVDQGKALILNNILRDRVTVSFSGAVVMPFIHKAELMDISVRSIEIDRRGADGLICRDNIRADIKVNFFVRVNKTHDDVIKVAQSLGCARASDPETLKDLFTAKFSEALKTAGKQLDFVDLYTQREEFRDQIIGVIGRDLNGFVLEDAAIDYLEQTPLTDLDKDNILDAQGIRKITELTAIENVRTNEFRRDEEKEIKAKDVEAREAILELDRQKSDAEARQLREVTSVQAHEEAETAKVQAEERLRSETARIRTDEEIAVQEENLKRQVAVAEKNRERVVAVETERVEKERQLEVIGREREVELQRISKDKELEHEKRAIADVVRERIAVDKTVAEQEEAIKRLRKVELANREKEARIIDAEGAAQEQLVKDIKAAEALEAASKFKAKEQLTLADAAREAAEREAQAQIRLAEGAQAQAAAEGLAKVSVKERDADATEKFGLAEARVKEADAAAQEKAGRAQAEVMRQQGLAAAESLMEKAKALAAMDPASRNHEEVRLKLETAQAIELAQQRTQRTIAEAQAGVVAEGLREAKVEIVGGESVFFDRVVGALSAARATDRFVDGSQLAQQALAGYTDGDADLRQDLKDVLTHSRLDATGLRDLTVAAALGRVLTAGSAADDPETAQKAARLMQLARELGLDDVKLG
ncbi:MAG: flotillin family protein [Acidobacteriota bacterium]